MQTRELVEALLARIRQGDAVGAASLFAETVSFQIPHHADVWWIPEVRSREDLARFFSGLNEHLETLQFDVDHLLVDGSEAVILGTLTDRVRRTGASFTSPFALHLSAKDNALTGYRFLEDTAAARTAATGSAT